MKKYTRTATAPAHSQPFISSSLFGLNGSGNGAFQGLPSSSLFSSPSASQYQNTHDFERGIAQVDQRCKDSRVNLYGVFHVGHNTTSVVYETRTAGLRRVRLYCDHTFPSSPPGIKVMCGPSNVCNAQCAVSHMICENVLAAQWTTNFQQDLFAWLDAVYKSGFV